MSKIRPALPIVPLVKLPLFEKMNKADQWYGLLPEIINLTYAWINAEKPKLALPNSVWPYFNYTLSLWESSNIIAGNGHEYFAVQSLRSILKRISLLWSTSTESGLDVEQILEDFKSDNISVRKLASQNIMDFAESKDSDFKLLYEMLSRYFSHVSNLDPIRINLEIPKDQLLSTRSTTLPILLILETGMCIVNCISSLLQSQGSTPSELTGGRVGHFSYSIKKYLRIAEYVMCEKHTRNSGIPLATLYKGVKDVQEEIGITNIYRGGMELFRYGKPDEKPEIKNIAKFSLFAVGKAEESEVHVKLISKTVKKEQYQVSWPKWWEIDATAILQIAAQKREGLFPLFDFIEDFIKVVNESEKLKSEKTASNKI